MRAATLERPVAVVLMAPGQKALPGLESLVASAELRFARDLDELRIALSDADTLFLWDFHSSHLRAAWAAAGRLEWVHAASVGLDTVLFDELIASDVVVTSSHGIFDKPIAEWVLGAMLALAKDLPRTLELQRQREWRHREPELLSGTNALIVGTGGIGRATARLLTSAGVRVRCIASTAREDPEFGRLLGPSDLEHALPEADWLILAAPLRPETEGMINADALALLRSGARLVNVGRGRLVVEDALIEALQSGRLEGAALDVFANEPLDPASPLWGMENVIVSPHMSGDVVGWRDAVVALFVENFQRRMRGEPLANVVDKATGRLQA